MAGLSSRRLAFARIAVLCASTLASLAIVELALRWQFGPPARFLFPQEQYQHDPEIGHSLVPHQRSFSHHVPVRINSRGLRDDEYSKEAPRGVMRVAAIGDSQTYGEGLPLELTWPKQLQQELNQARLLGATWEVINAGLSASDSWQHAIMLRRVLSWYDVDVVAVAIYVNDVAAQWEPGDAGEITNTPMKRIGYLLKRSAVLSLARRAFLQAGSADLELKILRGSRDDASIEEGWATMTRAYKEMKLECDARGIKLVAVILPRKDQVSGQLLYRGYQDRTAELLRAVGVEYVDLLDPFRDEYESAGEDLFIAWDGHNAGGANRIVAHRLLVALDELLVGDN